MARGMPSMLALLGLLAVAGYQNRDKISEALGGLQKPNPDGTAPQGGLGGILGGLGGLLGGAGGGLGGGLGELLNTFKTAGQGEVADSWVRPDVPTQGLTPDQVQQAIGEDNLRELSERTGLSRADLLARLATAIPQTVDRLTPNGNMPTDAEVEQRLLES
jgi:uncharacterized protein YidB (DUF937 family)